MVTEGGTGLARSGFWEKKNVYGIDRPDFAFSRPAPGRTSGHGTGNQKQDGLDGI
jgi:hypothetical protein